MCPHGDADEASTIRIWPARPPREDTSQLKNGPERGSLRDGDNTVVLIVENATVMRRRFGEGNLSSRPEGIHNLHKTTKKSALLGSLHNLFAHAFCISLCFTLLAPDGDEPRSFFNKCTVPSVLCAKFVLVVEDFL